MFASSIFCRLCLLAALVLTAPIALSESNTPLSIAVDAAWQRSPLARTLEARRGESVAGQESAQSWIAGSPSVGLSQRNDRGSNQTGYRETEVSVSAPIWLPGQRSARESLATVNAEELEAQIAQTRLAIAGEVREQLWAVAAAREELAEVQDHQRHLDALSGDVMRRVKAGDLARTDGLLAQQEVLAAKSAITVAQTRLQVATARYVTLTGQQSIPSPVPEPIAVSMQEPHPRMLFARKSIQRSQASLHAVNSTRSDPPTVGLLMRREQDGLVSGSTQSVGIAVQIPFGTNARNLPLESAALTKIETARAEAAQTESILQSDIELARQQLTAAEQGLQAASERAALTREHTELIAKSFRMGERGLNDLLRSHALSHEADVSERQQKVAVGLAHARLNQALGILP
ncbi:outer membrane cation efflux system protein [Janthinobacterium sp. Marseille]|uniref:TolC family protein n=1 Tax=Herminiimonas aquatilis TaxID=345342 RepID=A0ABW2J587_9BURK|nr:TolC family protein [Janthinobacterium sp. Marseille]ABR91610.1 outer membrane cation efflux system protein [Janthinobacterium sp. Marseille]MBX9799216.1 TolC family protein [Burkholderiaceae bacterium]